MRTTSSALTIAGVLAGCGGADPEGGGFGAGSGVVGITGQTGESSSTTGGGSSEAGSTTGAVPEDSSAGAAEASSAGEPLLDVGGTDFGGAEKPAGCQGKIDFLFVISNDALMKFHQAQLIAAVPQFIATIESKFADFDYHIMVVDGDDVWGIEKCNEECLQGSCSIEGYPCEGLEQLTECDATMGAGIVFPAGVGASNKQCKVAGGRRYLTREQPNLSEAFACVAQIGGAGGMDHLAEAMVAALSPELNGPGGCNEGFLRDDALLMVTFIYNTPDTHSAGKPKLWADAVLKAKHGDENAVVMFSIQKPECIVSDRICDLVKFYFPRWYIADNEAPDYGPAFEIATDMLVEACAEFVPR